MSGVCGHTGAVQSEGGLMVKVLSRGNGTNHVVGRDPATGNNVTVMDNLSDSQSAGASEGGRWG